MQTLEHFIVDIPKPINDTITLSSGVKLFVDTKFDEFTYRTTEGEIVSTPIKHTTGASKGDTLYFHHLVVVNGGQVVSGSDTHYLVKCDPKYTINNQAIAFKDKKSGDINPIFGWVLLLPFEENTETYSSIIEVVKLKQDKARKGSVAFTSPSVEALGLKVGDVVGFAEDMDYRITIDGKEYYRTRAEDLLYVEEA